jgi:hypothetical protein
MIDVRLRVVVFDFGTGGPRGALMQLIFRRRLYAWDTLGTLLVHAER